MAHPCERVLVIEDDRDLLATIEEVLKDQGVDVAVAATDEEVREVLRRGFRPNAILLDLLLGSDERAGERLLQRLRSEPLSRGIPIAVMSGSPALLRRVGRRAQATLTKPFHPDELYETLGQLCAGNVA